MPEWARIGQWGKTMDICNTFNNKGFNIHLKRLLSLCLVFKSLIMMTLDLNFFRFICVWFIQPFESLHLSFC